MIKQLLISFFLCFYFFSFSSYSRSGLTFHLKQLKRKVTCVGENKIIRSAKELSKMQDFWEVKINPEGMKDPSYLPYSVEATEELWK